MRLSFAVLCTLALWGCEVTGLADGGGSGGGAGGGGGSGVDAGATTLTLDAYCAGLGDATCQAGARCGVFDSVDGCRLIRASPRFIDACVLGRRAIAAGRMRFDGAAARACFDQLGSTCALSGGACDEVFVGLVPVDGGCYYHPSDECAAGASCVSGGSCPSRCRAKAGAGVFVTNSNQCLDGLYGRIQSTDAGFGFICEPRAAAGGRCTGSNECETGLVCNPETTRCEAARPLGASCTAADGGALTGASLFSSSEVCDPSASLVCARASAGYACQARRRLGEPCGQCRFDLQCGSPDGGAAQCLPLGTLGQFCSGLNGCIDGTYCQTAFPESFGPGICAARVTVGQSCSGGDSCGLGLACTLELSDAGFASFCRDAGVGAGGGLCLSP